MAISVFLFSFFNVFSTVSASNTNNRHDSSHIGKQFDTQKSLFQNPNASRITDLESVLLLEESESEDENTEDYSPKNTYSDILSLNLNTFFLKLSNSQLGTFPNSFKKTQLFILYHSWKISLV
jgi:flagellar basal body L-ring protein FlgH